MKIIKEVEIDLCDICEKEGWLHCIGCGKTYCDNCKKLNCFKFWSGVYGGTTYYVCFDCNTRLTKSGEDEFFNALKVIDALKKEYEGYMAGFEPRRSNAEGVVDRLEEIRHAAGKDY